MNAIEQLASNLRTAYPHAKVSLDAPKSLDGNWWLDFTFGPNEAEVEWRPGSGLGVSVNSDGLYGEKSDESYGSWEKAFERIKELIDRGRQTEPPAEVFLKGLRQSQKVTQAQLARLLRVKQASISKIENRADMHISTLRNIVSKLGADLEIRAVFPDGVVRIVQFRRGGKRVSKSKKSKARQVNLPAIRTR